MQLGAVWVDLACPNALSASPDVEGCYVGGRRGDEDGTAPGTNVSGPAVVRRLEHRVLGPGTDAICRSVVVQGPSIASAQCHRCLCLARIGEPVQLRQVGGADLVLEQIQSTS